MLLWSRSQEERLPGYRAGRPDDSRRLLCANEGIDAMLSGALSTNEVRRRSDARRRPDARIPDRTSPALAEAGTPTRVGNRQPEAAIVAHFCDEWAAVGRAILQRRLDRCPEQ